MYVRKTRTRKHDYYQLVRSYRDDGGRPRQEVLLHLGEHETPEAALNAWPHEIAEHRRNDRHAQAEKLQGKLTRLTELTTNREAR